MMQLPLSSRWGRRAGRLGTLALWALPLLFVAACAQTPASPTSATANAPAATVVAPLGTPLQERFVAGYLRTLPLDGMVDDYLKTIPKWPLQDSARATPQQIACVRGELSPAAMRNKLRGKALAYARSVPADQLEREVGVLEGGAADVFNRLFTQAIVTRGDVSKMNPRKIMEGLPPAKMKYFIALLLEPENESLRKALHFDGLGEEMLQGGNRAYSKGQALGLRLFAPVLIDAMTACNVDFAD